MCVKHKPPCWVMPQRYETPPLQTTGSLGQGQGSQGLTYQRPSGDLAETRWMRAGDERIAGDEVNNGSRLGEG